MFYIKDRSEPTIPEHCEPVNAFLIPAPGIGLAAELLGVGPICEPVGVGASFIFRCGPPPHGKVLGLLTVGTEVGGFP